MTVESNALFLNIDDVYGADELARPYRDLIGEGIVTGITGQLAVTERGAGANMSVDVAAGAAWVLGDESELQPLYRVRNDATVNLAISAADPTDPRIDIVVLEVLDSVFAGVSDLARLRVVTGTPAPIPSAPATPNTALRLATVDVAAADTSIVDADITEDRTFAMLGGGEALGVERLDEVATLETTASTSYVDLATVGPIIEDVGPGDYILEAGAQAANTGATNVNTVGFVIGSAAAVDLLTIQTSVANNFMYATRKTAITVTDPGTTVKLQYKVGAGTGSFNHRTLSLKRAGA